MAVSQYARFKLFVDTLIKRPKLRVLGALMGSKYLLREVRESGGAYGAGSQQADGAFRFFSYRDPAGLKTLTKYTSAIDWIMEQKAWGDRDVNEAILKGNEFYEIWFTGCSVRVWDKNCARNTVFGRFENFKFAFSLEKNSAYP